MKRSSLVLMVLLVAVVVTPVQGITYPHMLDDLSDISAAGPTKTGWYDRRDTVDQARPGWLGQGTGSMEIDYGVTNDTAGTADPCSGYDYQGNWVGVGQPLGAFNSTLSGGPYWWNAYGDYGGYLGDMDREIIGDFNQGNNPGQIPNLSGIAATHALSVEVYKSVANNSEHLREIQLYDSGGARNTYSVVAEVDANTAGAGWATYIVPLHHPLDNNADLTDIVQIRLFVTAWAASPTKESPSWPTDYIFAQPTGTPVGIRNLQLIPEPATIAMLSLGGLALLRRRKKA